MQPVVVTRQMVPEHDQSGAPALPVLINSPLPMLHDMTPAAVRDALAARDDITFVDVREPQEHATARLAGTTLIPLRTLPQHLDSLPRDHEIILLCHHGMRSEMAGNFLLAQGFARVSHVVGGIDAWSVDIDPTVPRY